MPFIYLKDNPKASYDLPPTGEFLIGRTPENNLAILDPRASRKHCAIVNNSGQVTITDCGSSNGTEVNGAKITTCSLSEGDEIAIGNTVLIYSNDPAKKKKLQGLEDSDTDPQIVATATPPADATQPLPTRTDRSTSSQQAYRSGKVYFDAIARLSRSMLNCASIGELLDDSFSSITELVPADVFEVHLATPGGLVDVAKSQKREGCDGFEAFEPAIKRALERGEAVNSTDVRGDPRFAENITPDMPVPQYAVASPLKDREGVQGVLYVAGHAPGRGIDEAEMTLIHSFADLITAGLAQHKLQESLRKAEVMRANLARYHSPDIAHMILSETEQTDLVDFDPKEITATVLFSDIVGFTPLSEKLSPAQIATLLNNYFERMATCIFKHRGSVNKFIGDAVMALFGAPIAVGNHALQAVQAALDMRDALGQLNAMVDTGKRVAVRIGINTGPLVAGNIGSRSRIEYTVIGDAVNTAQRMESIAKAGQILISESTYKQLGGAVEAEYAGAATLKGKSGRYDIYNVVGLRQ